MNLYHFPFCSGVIEEGLNCIPRRKYLEYPLKSTLATALYSLIDKTADLAGNRCLRFAFFLLKRCFLLCMFSFLI